MAPILKMASQHAKGVIFRNTINTLPMMSARTSLPGLKHHRFQGPNSTSLRHTRTYKISTGPLDGWGYTLFDCDYDLDLVDSINQEASHLGCEDLDLMYPKDEKDKKNVVKQLDTNLFRLLLQRFLVKGFTERAVYLGALAMRLGVKIRDTEMQVLRESVGRVKMYDEAREQMRAALKGYNPEGGCPWDFSYLGPTETQWQGGEEEGE